MNATAAQMTMDRPQKFRLVYLLAASHSGSTLTAMLLGAHPEVCTVGELKLSNLGDVDRYRCSCLSPIKACSFWNRVSEAMRRRGHAFDVANAGTDYLRSVDSGYVRRLVRPLHRGPIAELARDAALALSPAWRTAVKRTQRRNADLIASVLECTGKRIVLDSSKVGLRLKYLLRNPELDIRVIRIVRDGRAVMNTYMRPEQFADANDPTRRSGGDGGSRRSIPISMRAAAREWRRSNEEAEAVLATVASGRSKVIHYEDLCREPVRALNELFTFIGADPAKMVMDFRSVEQHIVGNGMRMDSSSEIRLDDRWKQALSAEELCVFEEEAGAMNRKLGYR